MKFMKAKSTEIPKVLLFVKRSHVTCKIKSESLFLTKEITAIDS